MPRFPRRESEVVTLVLKMITGYAANPGVFPNANQTLLQSKLTGYNTKKSDQTAAEAKWHLSTEAKDVSLHDLEDTMQEQLKQSEVDTHNDPTELELIGWGAKDLPTPEMGPGEPRDLQSVMQGPGTLKLDWRHPLGPGGDVRVYRIERRQQPEDGGQFGPWDPCKRR